MLRASRNSSRAAARTAVQTCPTGNGRSSIMNVGRRVDYAIRALSYLAAQPRERTVPRSEIRDRQGIPPHFLSKILRLLVNAGFLTSVPGARGGFRLERRPEDISIRDVYESVEGRLSLIECIDHGEQFCQFAPVCSQMSIWSGAQHLLESYLEKITVGDVADSRGLTSRLHGRALAAKEPARSAGFHRGEG